MMKPYLLTFNDTNIERKYQESSQQQNRKQAFISISCATIVTAVVKLIQNIVIQNSIQCVYLSIIILFLLIQLGLIYYNRTYIRVALIFLSSVLNIYLLAFQKQPDMYMAMIQGVNIMSITFLLVLIGEYIDGVICLTFTTIFRITYALFMCEQPEYSAIVSQIMLILYINYFNYNFHKAKRSQFLLTLMDQNQEQILTQLQMNNPFVLLQYDNGKLSFSIKSIKNCDKIFITKQDISEFIHKAIVDKIILSTYLNSKILNLTKNNIQNFNQRIKINYFKHIFQVQYTIFFNNVPNILIVFEQQQIIQNEQVIKYNCFINHLIIINLKLLNQFRQKFGFDKPYQIILRKMMIILLTKRINDLKSLKKTNLSFILKKLNQLESNIQIKQSLLLSKQIETLPYLLLLFLLIIFDNQYTDQLVIISVQQKQYLEIKMSGSFIIQQIEDNLNNYGNIFNLIFDTISISTQAIIVKHLNQVDIPFDFQYKQ